MSHRAQKRNKPRPGRAAQGTEAGVTVYVCWLVFCLLSQQRSWDSFRGRVLLSTRLLSGARPASSRAHNGFLFRVTLTPENSLISLLALERAPLWSTGQEELERPRPATHFLWGGWVCGVAWLTGGSADHRGAAVCPELQAQQFCVQGAEAGGCPASPWERGGTRTGTRKSTLAGRGEARPGRGGLRQEVASLQAWS